VTFPKPPTYDNVRPSRPTPCLATPLRRRGDADLRRVRPASTPDLRPREEARRFESAGVVDHGLAWTRDGRSIVWAEVPTASSGASGRMAALAQPVELAGTGARARLGPRQDRLVFTRYRWRPPSTASRLAARPPRSSNRRRWTCFQYSPDGTADRVRVGPHRHRRDWLAEASGSNHALTRARARTRARPAGLRTGRSVAFDSQGRRHWTSGAIPFDGSGLRQVPRSPRRELPSFRATAAGSTSAPTGRVARGLARRVGVDGRAIDA